jgi:hypothetical protein
MRGTAERGCERASDCTSRPTGRAGEAGRTCGSDKQLPDVLHGADSSPQRIILRVRALAEAPHSMSDAPPHHSRPSLRPPVFACGAAAVHVCALS